MNACLHDDGPFYLCSAQFVSLVWPIHCLWRETKTNCQGTDKADTPLCLKKESEIIELKNKIASKNRI
jgi:hypothetical protein